MIQDADTLTREPDQADELRTVADRLKWARERAGFSSPRKAANAFGWIQDTYRSHESGARSRRGLPPEVAARYARAFGVSAEWLLTGRVASKRQVVPVIGFVGSAAQVIEFPAAEVEEIAAPPGCPENAEAIVVRGDALYPVFRDGSVIVFWSRRTADLTELVGEEVVARLADGTTVVKVLEPGSTPRVWNLASVNNAAAPIRDAVVVWAAPVEIRLRRADWQARA